MSYASTARTIVELRRMRRDYEQAYRADPDRWYAFRAQSLSSKIWALRGDLVSGNAVRHSR